MTAVDVIGQKGRRGRQGARARVVRAEQGSANFAIWDSAAADVRMPVAGSAAVTIPAHDASPRSLMRLALSAPPLFTNRAAPTIYVIPRMNETKDDTPERATIRAAAAPIVIVMMKSGIGRIYAATAGFTQTLIGTSPLVSVSIAAARSSVGRRMPRRNLLTMLRSRPIRDPKSASPTPAFCI